jgi:sugar-specific transcriptional regulator TrmB
VDSMRQPRNGQGQWVSLKDHVDALLGERDKRYDERLETTEKALEAALVTADKALAQAKSATDRATEILTKRVELLESGGAPFASRLDESLSDLKKDVDELNEGAVRTEVLEALRRQQQEEAQQQKKTTKTALATAGAALLLVVAKWAESLVA